MINDVAKAILGKMDIYEMLKKDVIVMSQEAFEEHQQNLRKELARYNIDSAMLPMRHARTLGGCFHCITVDVERKNN